MSRREVEILVRELLDVISQTDYGIGLRFYINGDSNNDFIPSHDILHYINHFKEEKKYSHKICIAGKEPMLRPIDELGHVIQKALNVDAAVELRTDGAWVHDSGKAWAVWNMLGTLNAPRKELHSKEYIAENFRAGYPILMSRLMEEGASDEEVSKELRRNYDEAFLEPPRFTLSMFVDNITHSSRSAHYFIDAASHIAATPGLSEKMSLNVLVRRESWGWFREKVWLDPALSCDEFWEYGGRFEFKLNGCPVTGLAYVVKEKNTGAAAVTVASLPQNILKREPKSDSAKRQMTLHFRPDGTVSFDHECGKVSYINDNEKYKPWETLLEEMALQLVMDNAKFIKR